MKRKKYFIDRNSCACLIYILTLCLSFFIVAGTSGSEGLFYAGSPVILSEGLIFVSMVPAGSFVSRQISYRLGRDRISDAFVFVRGAMLVQLLIGVALAVIFLLAGGSVASALFGNRYDSLSLYALIPGLILGLLAGPLKGMLEGTGAARLARIGVYAGAAATIFCTVIFSRLGQEKGEKIALLLRNNQYASVYAGAGMALGVSLGHLVTFLVLGFGVLLVRRYYRIQDAGMELREEQTGGVMAYYLRKLLIPSATMAILESVLLVDYRLGLYLYGGHDKTGFGLHWWDGFVGVALPVLCGLSCLSVIFVSRLPRLCANDYLHRNDRALRLRYAMMQRLCGYMTIAASAFIFGAAKPIVQMVRHGLNAQARESAILTMKLGSIDIFLFACCMMVMLFFWQSGYERLLLPAMGIAFGFQLIAFLAFTHLLTISMRAMPIAMGVFCLAFLVTSTLLGWGSLMHATDLSWLYDDFLVLVCAGIACIPVELLNDFMTDEVVPAGGVILLLLIFGILFVLVSILLNAVDLANIRRLPGGKYIAYLARLMGK